MKAIFDLGVPAAPDRAAGAGDVLCDCAMRSKTRKTAIPTSATSATDAA
jgi:hypothetical protein